jgi:mRNA-degrading endonuclease RelE of RelBE toxin-antitoxin system
LNGMNLNENSTYKIFLSRSAANYIRRVDRRTQKRIGSAIDRIQKSPLKGLNIRRMVGTKGDYRYRSGSIRIVYTVDITEKRIYVFSIGPRGDVYK